MYYLRARYYDPTVGRFTQEDTHWNTANMIYGDNPQKINEREDALGLKTYSYAPQILSIMQAGNLYVYATSNPVKYVDTAGLAAEERLGQGIWSLKNDEFGVLILLNWLYGGGRDFIVENGEWGTYMKGNEILKLKVQKLVLPLAYGLGLNESKKVDITTWMEIQNGEDIIGYQYLHGTNADVGGFQIKGIISKNKKGDVTYDLTYIWNDKIDPNFMYYSDSKKAAFAKSIPFANPTDYVIRISWSDKTIIKGKETWYSWNSGWLK